MGHVGQKVALCKVRAFGLDLFLKEGSLKLHKGPDCKYRKQCSEEKGYDQNYDIADDCLAGLRGKLVIEPFNREVDRDYACNLSFGIKDGTVGAVKPSPPVRIGDLIHGCLSVPCRV